MATAAAVDLVAPRERTSTERPWLAIFGWLVALAPFFFLTYGLANWITSRRAFVPSVAFGWELSVPFLPWTIIPYWSSDLLYAASLAVCATRRELNLHVRRLITVQLIAVACFLAFPLRYVFHRPETHGLFGWLFDALTGFDRPFNQAPSLHVALAVILWNRFRKHLDGWGRIAMAAWLMLVVVSTMTTYQHQFLDLPTGALAGCLAIALYPESHTRLAQRLRLAAFYLSGAALAAAIACKLGGIAWILLWPALATLLVAIIYASDRPELFTSPLVRILAAPYVAAAWINSRWWTRRQEPSQEIAAEVWLGRAPFGGSAFRSVVNLAPELAIGAYTVPMLDLVTPTGRQLQDAVETIEACASQRPTLVCCALGVSRSAAAVAAWLVATGRARSQEEAIAAVRLRRPHVRL